LDSNGDTDKPKRANYVVAFCKAPSLDDRIECLTFESQEADAQKA